MRKSARLLGLDYGLTAQEMNYVLKEKGFLEGNPGGYSITEQGQPFAEEQDFHRGTGGYAQYNPRWTTRSWDESIANELDITDTLKHEARAAIAESKRQQWDEIKAARAEADARFLASRQSDDYDSDDGAVHDASSSDEDSDALGIAIIIGGLLAIGYGVYKASPVVINWWKTKVSPKIKEKKLTTGKGKRTKEMLCPACGETMTLDDKTGVWKCKGCDYSISDADLKNGEVFWFCDKCETFMNTQPGFNSNDGHWVCSECGFDNDVTPANIDED